MDPTLQRERRLPDGTPITLYRIGVIAALSGRSVGTVRRALAEGRIPQARYRQRREGAIGGRGDRWFTREQVEEAVPILRAPRPRAGTI
jgi:hypothetical protein